MALSVVGKLSTENKPTIDLTLAIRHHNELIERYLNSHSIRNHSKRTIQQEKRILKKWFESNGNRYRPLFTWEAMLPNQGRELIINYGKQLEAIELSSKTIRRYLSILKNYFSYVLEFPYVTSGDGTVNISDVYGIMLVQPVSEFDYPHNTFDGEQLGIPLDAEKVYNFYDCVRSEYLQVSAQYKKYKARNYTMMVVAGETGLRADELRHLCISDLFFEGNKIQTRWGKGTRGSGKRARVSLFPLFAQDSVQHYIKKYRCQFNMQSDYVFPTDNGNAVSYQTMQKELKKMITIAQKQGFPILPHFAWHWLRRLFATRFIERHPGKLSILINLLGHSSPNTVHRYIRHSEAWIDEQIKRMLEKGVQL